MHRRSDQPAGETHLREGAEYDAEVMDAAVIAGEGVEVLEEDAGLGMSCVRTVAGSEGWLRTAHLKNAAEDAKPAEVSRGPNSLFILTPCVKRFQLCGTTDTS